MSQGAVNQILTASAAFGEGCAATSHSHGAVVTGAWRWEGPQGWARGRSVPALLQAAAVQIFSTAHHTNRAERHEPWSSCRYLSGPCGRLLHGQRLDAYDGTGALLVEVTSVPVLCGGPNFLLLFKTLERRRCPAQNNRLVGMLYQIDLSIPDGEQEHTVQREHTFVSGADAGHRVILVYTRRVTVLVARGLHRRRCVGDPTVLLILDHADRRLPRIATNLVLDLPGALAPSVFSTTDDAEQLAVLLEDNTQNAADVTCPSADPVERTPPTLAARALQTTSGAEELAILPPDLAQDAAGVFLLMATLLMLLVPLRRLPSPTSEKTRKNLCTSQQLSASLLLGSRVF
ncbi:hypothetical protein V5799_024089 [Amblyomma americanum]|uniref:Uncharacterized protein n=1 Tax=Amblyomma americanum TaxID=6943 RepID=A0AAQ4ED02_AMBAM